MVNCGWGSGAVGKKCGGGREGVREEQKTENGESEEGKGKGREKRMKNAEFEVAVEIS